VETFFNTAHLILAEKQV